MFLRIKNNVTRCNCCIISWGGVRMFGIILLLSTFLIYPAFADTTNSEINSEYLNELTGDNVTWNVATEEEVSSGYDIVLINGAYYKYTYNNSEEYTETSTRLNNNLSETNTQSVVFKNIANSSDSAGVSGGAIYNEQTFDKPINADFIGNYALTTKSYSSAIGGAIYNIRTIGDITGDFIGNYTQGTSNTHGGAIYNNGTIGDITGDFISNYAQSTNVRASGGAIYNNSYGTIGDITGDFINNYAQSSSGYESHSGAIFNKGTIGDITGDFIDNYVLSTAGPTYGGAIYNEDGTIGDIIGNFINNYVQSCNYQNKAYGGAIYNDDTIGYISGDFISNYALSKYYARGGAIYNGTKPTSSAVPNMTIGDITGDFTNNYAQSSSNDAQGGAIFNEGTIGDITGDFSGNYAQTIKNYAYGGAIYNYGTIGDITGDFSGNYAQSDEKPAYGGAIYNDSSTISLINSSFYNNYAQTTARSGTTYGGAIYNRGTLNITANDGKQSVFSGNKIMYLGFAKSNAIHMEGGTLNLSALDDGQIIFDDGISGSSYTINIDGDDTGRIEFNNEVSGLSSMEITGSNVYFGNESKSNYTINANGGVVNNAQVQSSGVLNVGSGAAASNTTVNSGGKLHAKNEAKINGLLANGGALIDLEAGTVLTGDVTISTSADLEGDFDYSQIFSDDIDEGEDEEVPSGSLTLVGGINETLKQGALVNTVDNKSLVLSDGLYEIGLGKQEVTGWSELNLTANTEVKLAGDIALADVQNKMNLLSGSTLNLAGNSPLIATIDGSVNNDGMMTFSHNTDGADDVITIKGDYKAYKNASMTIDVDVASNSADILKIEGDVIGRTSVVINPINDNGGTATMTDKALFVEAPNDDTSTGAYFDVYRMVADARVWNSLYENNKWYVATGNVIDSSSSGYGTTNDDEELVLGGNNNDDNTVNITTGKPQVVAEAIAYMSLPKIGLEQTKDLVRIVSNKVTSTKAKCGDCGVSEYAYNGKALNGVWIDLSSKKSNIDAPVEVEAKINAVDLGFDVQSDLHHRLGIFASYRQGEYELSGMGKDYYSKVGSDIDVDSWMMGLYHRYDKGRIWTMSTLYAGLQKIDLTTDDGVSADTEGKQLGGSVEVGMVFEPQKRLTIEPSIRLGYNFIKYDDISDRYGKTAQYDNIHNVEAEAGVKVEKTWNIGKDSLAKLYVKPSLIQNLGKGGINITSLDTVEGLENDTLLRGEIGGSINLGNGWSGYGAVGHTFGDDYNATDFNVGISFSW